MNMIRRNDIFNYEEQMYCIVTVSDIFNLNTVKLLSSALFRCS